MDVPLDLLITGGTVLDPAAGIRGPADVGIIGSQIVAVGPALARDGARLVIDATGCVVTPGLIDHSDYVSQYASDAD